MNYFLFIIGVIGMTMIINRGKIFNRLRSWLMKKSSFLGHAIKCSMCVGFWSGVLGYLVLSDTFILLGGRSFITELLRHEIGHVFFAGCTGSILSYSYCLIMKYFIEKYEK